LPLNFRSFSILKLALSFSLAYSSEAKAQLCNGSLGDPVVNMTFSSGTTANAPGYVFTSSSCPSDGLYTIAPSSSNCFSNTWHTVSDHTGGGSFMLVNASFQPGDFFVQTVSDLCPNTTYEFAAWIMNVLNRPGGGIMPNLTFKIETPGGVVLKDFQTGDISHTSSPEWKQYGFYFTTPAANAKIILRITNNAPGGIGNDIALDDITFRPCGELINASILGYSDTVIICEGNPSVYTLEGNVSSSYQSPAYQWQLSTDKGLTWKDIPGANAATYQRQPTTSGDWWYRLAVLESRYLGVLSCRIASNIIIIEVGAKPVVNAGPDRVMLVGESITLNATADGDNLVYLWKPDSYISSTTTLKPTINPGSDMVYTLSAVSKHGCANQDETFIKVVQDIFIPNAFTPNGDGNNDNWKIPFLDPSFDAEVTVANRYGQLVYHSKGATVLWDGTINGKQQPAGTYVYIVTMKTGNFKRMGTITLIR